MHSEERRGKGWIHDVELVLFRVEADELSGAGEELVDKHVCIGVLG